LNKEIFYFMIPNSLYVIPAKAGIQGWAGQE